MIRYTKKEEILNSSSHGAGILLGVVVGIIFLVWCFRGGDGWARTGVILYLFGMLGSYITSTIYHALPRVAIRPSRSLPCATKVIGDGHCSALCGSAPLPALPSASSI